MPAKIIEKNVTEIPNTAKYWLVRTDGGDNFDTFYNNNFIGIGWNKITLHDLTTKSESEVKSLIAKDQGYDLSIKKGKKKATDVYNKLQRFSELKKGDFIVIPSSSSTYLAFGKIADSKIYLENDPQDGCRYIKRRRVIWERHENIYKLDTIFFKLIISRHSISSLNAYSEYIDKVIQPLYEKNGFTHFVIEINKEGDIDIHLLTDLLNKVEKLARSINNDFGFGEENEQLSVKLRLQSPGLVEFKRQIGKTIAVLAIVLSSCRNGQIQKTGDIKIDTFVTAHEKTLKETDSILIKLEAKRDSLK